MNYRTLYTMLPILALLLSEITADAAQFVNTDNTQQLYDAVLSQKAVDCTRKEETLYEGIVKYQRTSSGWWMRCDGKVDDESDYFFPRINTYNSKIDSLVTDILGYRPNRTWKDREVWLRVNQVWKWLQQNQLSPNNPNYAKADRYIESLPSWPSISNIAHMYYKYRGICWGTCMSRAQLFATLLYSVGIPPEKFAITESRWKPEYSQHKYVILHVNQSWFYLDPTYIEQRLTKDAVFSVGHGRADYIHPRSVILLPGSTISGVPLISDSRGY